MPVMLGDTPEGRKRIAAANIRRPLGNVKPASGVTPLPMIDGAKIRFLGHGHFLVTLDVIVQTGSDVNTLIELPFSHELVTMSVKHVDASEADNTDAENITLKHRYGNLWFNMWSVTAGTGADVYAKFSQAYMLPGQYQIVTNTTNTHKMYVQMEVYIMEEG